MTIALEAHGPAVLGDKPRVTTTGTPADRKLKVVVVALTCVPFTHNRKRELGLYVTATCIHLPISTVGPINETDPADEQLCAAILPLAVKPNIGIDQ